MLRRQVYIENRRTLADSGDLTIDLRITDPISAIWVEVRNVNGATNNKSNRIADCIETVQLLDGSDVICSVSGHELFAAGAYKLGRIPYQLIDELPGNTQNLHMPLIFGRWFGDQSFALDPSKFKNLQIRVKWNFAAVTAIGATGFTTGTGTLTLVADVMEGVASPLGILTLKRHYSFTTVASGIEYVDLPVDQAIKSLFIRSFEAATGGLSGISNLKLGADQSKAVFFDQRKSDFVRFATCFDEPFIYKHNFHAKNGDTLYPILKQDETVALQNYSGDNVLGYTNNGVGEGALSALVGGSAQTSNISIDATVQGYLPYNVVHKEMGDFDDPSTWLDPAGIKSLRLELTQDNAGAATSVVLEQARLY